MIMKKYLFASLFCFYSLAVNAQTTLSAGGYSPAVGTTFNTGQCFVTFAVRNNNNFPIVLTNLTTLEANLYENNNFTLYYSSTSLGGLPTIPGAGWTQVSQSLQPITSTVIGQVAPFNCIGLVIPQNTTYRFALMGSKGIAMRTNGATGLTPNIFSTGNVDLMTGDYTIVGQSARVGYLGGPGLPNFVQVYFDGSISFIQAPGFTDIQVLSVTKPATACNATNSFLSALICNRSPQNVNIGNNNITVNFNVNGPNGVQTSNFTMNTGTMAPCSCLNAAISGINFSASGKYIITANASIAGVTDNNLTNNTYVDSLSNYKPVVSPNDSICQYSSAGLFAGFTASSCTTRKRTYTLNSTVLTPQQADGSSDATATAFATSALPLLPDCSVITGGYLLIENLNATNTGTFGNEARFNIYGPAPNGASNPFVPGIAGSPLNFSVYNFDYKVNLSAAQLNNMYAALGNGGAFSIGYWETFDDLAGTPDAQLNAQGLTTTAKIFIDYEIQSCPKWFLTAAGGSSVSNNSNFNPFLVPGSGISNTNTVGTYTFYAACGSDTVCRVPVTLKIKPSPAAIQDSLEMCELISSSGNSIFDLTSLSNSVSGGNASAIVDYYYDIGLSNLIPSPNQFNSTSNVIYSKVSVPGGCVASDSVILTVHPKPEFGNQILTGSVCAPNCINTGALINPFALVPSGSDTLYYADPGFSVLHPNPYSVCASDTVYMILETNTMPACRDTAEAYLAVMGGTNHIAGQDVNFNFSYCGTVGLNQFSLTDGQADTLRTFTDCAKMVAIKDEPDGTSLGQISVEEEIFCTTQFYLGAPYVNREYKITPANNDSASVCLYYLDDDFNLYNTDANPLGFPPLPLNGNMTAVPNICITSVENDTLGGPLSTATLYSGSQLNVSYDASTTVWTICFPVAHFSTFYCHTCFPFFAPLPVLWHSFEVQKSGNNAQINWSTGMEQNSKHFVVERSMDGIHFIPVSDVIPSQAPNGNSQSILNYRFIDSKPEAGVNYYRIRQTDIDLKTHYTEIKSIVFGDDLQVSMHPNPVQDQLSIRVFAPSALRAKVEIRDASGRLIKQSHLSLSPGAQEVSVEMQDLADGVYVVTFESGTNYKFSRLIRKQ